MFSATASANLPTKARPERVTVSPNKGVIDILCIGSFDVDFYAAHNRVKNDPKSKEIKRRVIVAIPHGLICRTLCSGRQWIFETKVSPKSVLYQCFWEDKPQHASGWRTSPSAAYKQVNVMLIKLGFSTPKYDKNENGALLIGVTYGNVQAVIKKHMPEQYAKFLEKVGAAKPQPSLIKKRRTIEDDEYEDVFTRVEKEIINRPLSAPDITWFQDKLGCSSNEDDMVWFKDQFGRFSTEDDLDRDLFCKENLQCMAKMFQMDDTQPLILSLDEEDELAEECEPLPYNVDNDYKSKV